MVNTDFVLWTLDKVYSGTESSKGNFRIQAAKEGQHDIIGSRVE